MRHACDYVMKDMQLRAVDAAQAQVKRTRLRSGGSSLAILIHGVHVLKGPREKSFTSLTGPITPHECVRRTSDHLRWTCIS